MASVNDDLPYLIRLLDDKDPLVRPVVHKQFSKYGGDISHDLAALGIEIDAAGRRQLSGVLAEGRRLMLRDEWQVPTGGAEALEDDWESFESMLRLIADFLHDGITLRPSLPDSLDLLVDKISETMPAPTANDLRRWLFVDGVFKGATKRPDEVRFYDLCHVIETGQGNPTSLGCLFMLLGRRFGVQVDGCNYPGYFLVRVMVEGRMDLIDCFHAGRRFDVEALIEAHPELSSRARAAVSDTAHLGTILLRYITEIKLSLSTRGRKEDAALFAELADTLTG